MCRLILLTFLLKNVIIYIEINEKGDENGKKA